MTKKLYQFEIGKQYCTISNQDCLKNQIKRLLEIAPIEFSLEESEDNLKQYKKQIYKQTFTFEKPEEARDFGLDILNTGAIFFCSLREVKVK
jgi:hypothetical protein